MKLGQSKTIQKEGTDLDHIYFVFQGEIKYGDQSITKGQVFGGSLLYPELALTLKNDLEFTEGKYSKISIDLLQKIMVN